MPWRGTETVHVTPSRRMLKSSSALVAVGSESLLLHNPLVLYRAALYHRLTGIMAVKLLCVWSVCAIDIDVKPNNDHCS